MTTISVINHTSGLLSDAVVQSAIRAINRQIAQDFAPHWGMDATLKLEGHSEAPGQPPPSTTEMRGDAIIYIWHPMDVRLALGFHGVNFLGIPYGFVFPELARLVGEDWTATFSHEALELIADPDVNLLVMGPHPRKQRSTVFYWYEVCDAVQDEEYKIDGVAVSNFVLPLYFTSGDEITSRNDFLGLQYGGRTLKSFGVNPGGYVGYFDPETRKMEVYFAEGDIVSLKRLTQKKQLGLARRSRRYQAFADRSQSTTASIRQFLAQD